MYRKQINVSIFIIYLTHLSICNVFDFPMRFTAIQNYVFILAKKILCLQQIIRKICPHRARESYAYERAREK